MSTSLKTAMGIVGLVVATSAAAQVTFYSRDGFRGESFTADREIRNLDRTGFNDRAQSAVVRGGSWQVCEDALFEGRCVVLQPGEYPSLSDMGLGREISSVRAVAQRYGSDDGRRYVAPAQGYAAPPAYVETRPAYPAAPAYVEAQPQSAYPAQAPDYDYRRRADERLFEAQVTSVHAVVGPPEQRCWVERREASGSANIPGAIAGAVIGGVLGHQIGGGRGQDVATAGGAIAGAAVGANVGRNGYAGDVQRCSDVARNDRPDYFDVTYVFDGLEHHAQMSAAPGPTIMVNRAGEPRV
ncbi:MAG: beta/gamma crystallin-related protein [Betaproteobacteria bacterium]